MAISFEELLEPLPDGLDFTPRPRYAPKCVGCGRFVKKSTVRRGRSPEDDVEFGDCAQCGRREVE